MTTLDDEVRIRLLVESFHYSILRRGLEIESAEVPVTTLEPEPIPDGEYYGGSEVMD